MNARPFRCLITAGPTREYFDPVRYMSNPSSGKMGYAIAEACVAKGWDVTLVSGPVALDAPAHLDIVPVVTGDDMLRACQRRFTDCDILIMTAAVMDFRPSAYSVHKVKKTGGTMTVTLEPTTDILMTLAATKAEHQIVVGFAAETQDVVAYGRAKLQRKRCDLVVANSVAGADGAFGADHNHVFLIGADSSVTEIGPDSKTTIALALADRFEAALKGRVSN